MEKSFTLHYRGSVPVMQATNISEQQIGLIEDILLQECKVPTDSAHYLSHSQKLECRLLWTINSAGNKVQFNFKADNCYSIKLIEKSKVINGLDRFEVRVNPGSKVFWVLGFLP